MDNMKRAQMTFLILSFILILHVTFIELIFVAILLTCVYDLAERLIIWFVNS